MSSLDLCKAINGTKRGGSCAVPITHDVGRNCKAIGGETKGDTCFIPDESLEKLAQG